MTQVLQPSGPFLLIMYDPIKRRCEVKGTLENKAMSFEMLDRAKRTLEEHYEELAARSIVEKPKLIITDFN